MSQERQAATRDIQPVLEALPRYVEAARSLKDILLANLVMLAEIPAPTFGEQERIAMLEQRFCECGLSYCAADDAGNAVAVLRGCGGQAGYTAVAAHADTIFAAEADHTVSLQCETVSGVGMADDAMGLAVLATLPTLLERLQLPLKHDLMLLGDVRSLGKGNIGGIRAFLDNNALNLRAAICVEGGHLGRLSYFSSEMLRGEIVCQMPEPYEWQKYGAGNAILLLNEVINEMHRIPLPQQPLTHIVLGEVRGGTSFHHVPIDALLRFEVRSEEPGMAAGVGRTIAGICSELASRRGANVRMDVIATRKVGGLPFDHPLPAAARDIQAALNLQPRIAPSFSELAAFIDAGVPAVTIGTTWAQGVNTTRETLQIQPMFTGLAQLVGLLVALDNGGLCDG